MKKVIFGFNLWRKLMIILLTVVMANFFVAPLVHAAIIPSTTVSFTCSSFDSGTIYSYNAPNGSKVWRISGESSFSTHYGFLYVYADGNLIAEFDDYNQSFDVSNLSASNITVITQKTSKSGLMGIKNGIIYVGFDVADNDAVKDAGGTVLSAARNAYSAAEAAKNSAATAATNAQNAYNAANAAKTSAAAAAANTIYNGQSAAYWAYQAAQSGADTTPPVIQKVQGLNGATCTTTGTFSVVVQATDNRAGQLQARAQVDGGAWTGWYNIPGNAIPVTLSSSGAHTITVEVKDLAGNTSQATITAFRI
ncbi:hypothetical protein E308F_10650 [Moorella sp. E308F]|jgi:hypothetical protein|uniref:hypothetical protein n=1 Tax=Moorella sp. E308F TaxID=2572682 RepID=UPI0010FFC57C|nr:hypothetical protein [Moorella sp. E308F]GEA14823.1 hypothetical protein E308F_10650 [Moorella sp. E308F]